MKPNIYTKILATVIISIFFCIPAIAEENKSDWARAYMRVVNSLINQYGEGSVKTEDFIGDEEFMAGVATVRLIDFDGDGGLELYCAFSNNGLWVNRHVVYGYNKGLVTLMEEARISNQGTDVSPSTTFLSKDGKVYLVDEYEIAYGNYYTLQDGQLISVLSYDGFKFTDTPVLNGAAAASDEIALAKAEMEKGGTIEKIKYYYDLDTDVISKTEEVINELADICAQPNPTYESQQRISEEGLEEDYIYTFSDGTINPKIDEPILMINGTFHATTPLVTAGNDVKAPLRGVAEALGADVAWSEAENKVTISYEQSTIELIKGQYGVYKILINGEDSGNADPYIVDNTMYMQLQFFIKIFGLDNGYLPSAKMNIGIGLAANPVIWLDRTGTYHVVEKSQNEGLDWLKGELRKRLESFKRSNESSEFVDEAARAIPQIAKDIENTKYIGQVGRYAVYYGAERTILVDFDTNAIYFHREEHAYGYIEKPSMNDQQLFYMGYILG